MKTKKIIAAIGLFAVATFIVGSSAFAGLGGKTGTPGPGKMTPVILSVNYVVNVQDTKSLDPKIQYFVLLLDQKGNIIGKQLFDSRVSTYSFWEKGPVYDARVAGFSKGGNELLAKDLLAGPFHGGVTYWFNLDLSTVAPNPDGTVTTFAP